ncbi:hypothetical protein ACJJIF_07135 [Microbulbifer sp. SSSA002]|uniref:hypothetical protein n=1 Tax=Microbulbifer sp. SSSA002 TaxID=3243376 RepID=UPI0040392095
MNTKDIEVSAFRTLTPQGLDPITVLIENTAKGAGQITLSCCGEAWNHFWPRMGEQHTLETFFLSASTDYLSNKLFPNHLQRSVTDFSEVYKQAKTTILEDRREHAIDKQTAKRLWTDIRGLKHLSDDYELQEHLETICEVFGQEWYELLPTKDHHEFTYLCKIIDAVKEALKLRTAEQLGEAA